MQTVFLKSLQNRKNNFQCCNFLIQLDGNAAIGKPMPLHKVIVKIMLWLYSHSFSLAECCRVQRFHQCSFSSHLESSSLFKASWLWFSHLFSQHIITRLSLASDSVFLKKKHFYLVQHFELFGEVLS